MIRVLLALTTLLAPAARAADPSWRYEVLRTTHFEIIYHDTQKELAKRYALAAEQAHELLTPLFKEMPDKTVVMLEDDTDGANGLATFLPYPHITVYPVLPSTLDSVDEYGDWALEMMLHEYTHILNMHPRHGLYWPLKFVFGTLVRPNALLPKWYLEGLAVNVESRWSDHGRLRAPDTHAAARALTKGGVLHLEDISRINEQDLATWPYGARPYLYGGWWWENAQREKGAEVIETLNQNYARRLPYFLNGPMEEQLGKSAGEFFALTLADLQGRARTQLETIERAGAQAAYPVAETEGEQVVFAVSPSGSRLLYWQALRREGALARLKTRRRPDEKFSETPSGEKLFRSDSTVRARWLDEDRFVFDKVDNVSPYTSYRDLYLYDLRTRKQERLTTGARAQEAAPSPDGQRIAFIQNDGGRNRLSILSLTDRKVRPLLKGGFNQRLSMPEFLSDGEILFSLRTKNGDEKLEVYDLATKRVRAWNEELKSAQNPRASPEGLLVTDARTGVRNVYAVSADGRARPLSNTLTDIQTVDFDPGRREIVFSELTPAGRRLMALPLQTYAPPTIRLDTLPPPPRSTLTKVAIRQESYQPIAYLWPRYWIPFIYQVEEGYVFQGLTANQDPAEKNRYELLASYDSITKKPSYGGSFVNRSTPVDIGAGYQHSISYLGASQVTLESQAVDLDFSSHWPFNSRRLKWTLGGTAEQVDGVFGTYKRQGPQAGLSWRPSSDEFYERWSLQMDLFHQQYVGSGDQLAYGRSYLGLANRFTLSGRHQLFLQTRAALSPKMPSRGTIVDLGDRSLGGNYLVNLANSNFLLRGYPSGSFIGRKVLNANLEYVFPAVDLDRGFGSFPLFLRDLEVALFTDAMALDGYGFGRDEGYSPTKLSRYYMGSGAEMRFQTTTGYHLPLTLTLGLYYGYSERFGGGFSPFFGIGFGGLDPLQAKTP